MVEHRSEAHRARGVAAVGSRFSAAAATYEARATVQRRVAETLTDLVRLQTAGRAVASVLEVGCGTGLLTRRLVTLFPGAAIEAVDIAPRMIEAARAGVAGGRVRFAVAGPGDLPAGGRFDLIASSSALHWMAPLPATLNALRARLVPGGLLVFGAMLHGTLGELHVARQRVAPAKRAAARLADERELQADLRDAGFSFETLKRETLTERHESGMDLLRSLHALGLTGGAVSSSGVPLTRSELARLADDYERHYAAPQGGVLARYEVVYVAARPAASAGPVP